MNATLRQVSGHKEGDVPAGASPAQRDFVAKLFRLNELSRTTDEPQFFNADDNAAFPPEDQGRFANVAAATADIAAANQTAAQCCDALRKALTGISSLEDLRKKPEAERLAKAGAIRAALDKVAGVRDAFRPIRRGAEAKIAVTAGAERAEWQDRRNEAVWGANRPMHELPSGFDVNGVEWEKPLLKQLEPFAKTAGERQDALKEATNDAAKAGAKTESDKLRQAITPYQTRTEDRASLFFDVGRNKVGMSLEHQQAAQAATDKLVEMGLAILDNGGGFPDVQKVLEQEGFSQDMWPPRLVAAVQAWRKTNRALVEERAAKVAKFGSGERANVKDNTLVLLEWIGNYTSVDGAARGMNRPEEGAESVAPAAGLFDAGQANELAETVDLWMGSAVSGIAGVATVFDMFMSFADLVKTARSDAAMSDKLLAAFSTSVDTLVKMASLTKSGLDMFKSIKATSLVDTSLGSTLGKVVPGLGLAVAGAEFGKALNELRQSAQELSKSKSAKKEGYVQFLYDENRDEAMLGALANDIGAQQVKVARDSIKTGTAMLNTTAAGAQFGGPHGVAAAAGLSVISSGISLGGKVVLHVKSWSDAKKARAMIQEAQAGNMDAQVEVFEKSGFYAKMYIAMLAKEKNPMALRYLIDHGVEDEDLEGATGYQVLRDAMLEKAGQRNDADADPELFPGLAKAVKVLEPVMAPIAAPEEAIRQMALTKPYDKDAPAHGFGADPAKWGGEWETAKVALRAKGMINDPTGVAAALTRLASAHAKLTAAATADDYHKFLAETDRTLEVVTKARPGAYDPNKLAIRILHQPAKQTLGKLATALSAHTDTVWTRIYALTDASYAGAADKSWTPPAGVPAALDASAWTAFWEDGKAKRGFPKDPAGDLVTTVVARRAALAGAPADKKRAAAASLAAGLEELSARLSDALDIPAVNRQEKAVDWIGGFLLLLNPAWVEVDAALSADGENKLPDLDVSDLGKLGAGWDAVWTAAKRNGLTADPSGKPDTFTDDAGFSAAVKDFSAAHTAYSGKTFTTDPKGTLKAYREMEIAAGKVAKTRLEFVRLHRLSVTKLKNAAVTAATAVEGEALKLAKANTSLQASSDYAQLSLTGKDVLSSAVWRKNYTKAVESGAVLESKTAEKTINSVLKVLKTRRADYENAKKSSSLRAAADTLVLVIDDVNGAVKFVLGYKQYASNPAFSAYLTSIQTAVLALHDQVLKDVCTGKKANTVPTPFRYSAVTNADWQKNKKAAIAAGAIRDRPSGVKAAIEALLKADAGAKTEAKATLNKAIEGQKNGNIQWNAYLTEFTTKVTALP